MGTKMCFMQDNDAHWYLIEWADRDLFEELLNDSDDEFMSFLDRFEINCINTHPSHFYFINPVKGH